VLQKHVTNCTICRAKHGDNKPISPPFAVKDRLYAISAALKNHLLRPMAPNQKWYTSSWQQKINNNPEIAAIFS